MSASSLTLPTSRDLSGATNLQPVTGFNVKPASDALRFPDSSLGGSLNAGHGQDGYFIQAPLDANHSTFIMIHSVWAGGSDVILNQPPAGGNPYFLYAPTTHPPNSCIEAGTAYMNLPARAQNFATSYVYFDDLCKNGGTFTWFADDAAFRSQYVFTDAASGAPSIAIIITTLNSSLSSPDWNAYVWNVSARRWDFFYASPYAHRTSAPPALGWSIFEPNFQSQPAAQSCRQPRMPAFVADDLQFYNLQNGQAAYVDGSTASRTTWGACVTPDATGAASFSFTQFTADGHWRETATGQ